MSEIQTSAWESISYPILTERLLMRPFLLDDLAGLHAISSRADVTRFVPWEPRSEEEVGQVLQRRVDGSQEGMSLAVVLRADATILVGDVSLHSLVPQHGTAEVGFIFHPDHHGAGLAGEAAEAVLSIAFDLLGLHRVIGRCDARNAPSARLMERLGMRREAHLIENEFLKGEWTDELDYGILEREWLLRQVRAAPRRRAS